MSIPRGSHIRRAAACVVGLQPSNVKAICELCSDPALASQMAEDIRPIQTVHFQWPDKGERMVEVSGSWDGEWASMDPTLQIRIQRGEEALFLHFFLACILSSLRSRDLAFGPYLRSGPWSCTGCNAMPHTLHRLGYARHAGEEGVALRGYTQAP